jgi:anti-sigma factor RsiW
MSVTRDVIVDLLPMYLDGEVSLDTRALVEAYLERDSALAEVAKQSLEELGREAPEPIRKENGMKAYERAKRWMFLRTVVLAAFISAAVLAFLAFAALAWMLVIR